MRTIGTTLLILLNWVSHSAADDIHGGGGLHTAADPDIESTLAHELTQEGIRAAKEGDCDHAEPILLRSEHLGHQPQHQYFLAACLAARMQFVEAYKLALSLAAELEKRSDAREQRRLLADTRTFMAGLANKIATVIISAQEPSDGSLQIKLNGKALPPEMFGVALPVREGEISIEASASHFLPWTEAVYLKAGERHVFTVALRHDSTELRPTTQLRTRPSKVAPAPGAAEEGRAVEAGAPLARWLSYTAWGLGAAGLGVGSALGIATIQKKSHLTGACPQNRCTVDQQSGIDDARRVGRQANIAFAIGLTSAVVGTLLFLASAPEPTATTQGVTDRVQWTATPHGALLFGHFD